jgi:Sec-independent protein translocase protein TatA
MLTVRDHVSGDLFDPWDHLGPQRRQLLERSWAGVFREYLLRHLPIGELAKHFHDEIGRPSKDLHAAMGALILQQLHDLTDKQAVEAVALNIAWHYALDIRTESDAYLCERTLRNYRLHVIKLELEQTIFRTLTDRLINAVGVNTDCQRLDSTAIRSAIRGLTRLGILVEATSKFLRELKRTFGELHDQVNLELNRRYVDRQGDGCFANTKPSESKRRLPEAAKDIHELIEQFRSSVAHELPSFQLLVRIFDEQCEVVGSAPDTIRVRLPEEMPCDNVLSPADPDASYNKRHGIGYMVQLMETFSEDNLSDGEPQPSEKAEPQKPDLITHVAVNDMTIHDQHAIGPALNDTEDRTMKPRELLADSHYGSTDALANARKRGVNIVAPAMTAKGKLQGKLTLEDFTLDEEGRVTRCPEGHAPLESNVANIRLQVLFDAEVCNVCPNKSRCMVTASGRSFARYQYTHDRVRQRQRRLNEKTEAFRNRYRWRAGIEATMSRFKHQMGMARLRVRGMSTVSYVAFLRALGLNIHRVAVYHALLRTE